MLCQCLLFLECQHLHLRRWKVLQSQRADCLNLGFIHYSFHLKPVGLRGKEDECFGIKTEPIMEGRSCPTEGPKARQRCEAWWAIASEMNFPLSFVVCRREVTARLLTITHVRGRQGDALNVSVLVCMCVCVCVHLCSFVRGNVGRKEGTGTQGLRVQILIQPGVSCLEASQGGSRHQYLLITPEARSANTDFSWEKLNIFGFMSRQGERHFRQNIQMQR